MGAHNEDLIGFKEKSTAGPLVSEKEEKTRADELTRLALKQKQLDYVADHLDTI